MSLSLRIKQKYLRKSKGISQFSKLYENPEEREDYLFSNNIVKVEVI